MEYYEDLQIKLIGINVFLQTIFPGTPFFAATLNLGPKTVCLIHRDWWNLANGTCGIGVLGPFNHRTGGHIILHEPRVIMEVRRGDFLWIPSAAITHENAPIKEHEVRYSCTLYSAGGLFRYAECGGRTVKDLESHDKPAHDAYVSNGEARWEAGWSKYSTVGELGIGCPGS